MSKLYQTLDKTLQAFIAKQNLFFVATAPSGALGHVNLSPKGLDTFRILGERTVAYLDYTGSGVETIAHLRDNGRICILFCAFAGRPKILRLHGTGRVVEPQDPAFGDFARQFSPGPPARAIIVVECERIHDSCGYGVPLYEYQGPRTQISDWSERKGPAGIAEYQRQKNATSLDGLPGLRGVGLPE